MNATDKPLLNIHPSASPTFDPAAENLGNELEHLREQIEAKAIEAINWYLQRKARDSRYSRQLRLMAILLTAVGGLMPIVQGFAAQSVAVGQAGYVALALAATCVGLDKFFGFSSAWMRYSRITESLK